MVVKNISKVGIMLAHNGLFVQIDPQQEVDLGVAIPAATPLDRARLLNKWAGAIVEVVKQPEPEPEPAPKKRGYKK